MGSDVPSADDPFWQPRRCMRTPIAEVFAAAHKLDLAVTAHLLGNRVETETLLIEADCPKVRRFSDGLLRGVEYNPDQWKWIRYRHCENMPKKVPKAEQAPSKPDPAMAQRLRDYWGFNCAFCSMPLVREEVRAVIAQAYPDEGYWLSNKNEDQHAALQCMWLQYDHLVPRSRGGETSFENLVITCAPCNYGRMERTVEECGLEDPRSRLPMKTSWDGLERLLDA